MPSGERRRNLRIDNAKGILITLVVIGHFLLPFAYRTRLTANLFYAIYSFHMPAFVFVSGMLSGNMFRRGRFRWDRVLTSLWVYLVFEVLVFFTEVPAYQMDLKWPDFLHETGAPWYVLALTFWYIPIRVLYPFRRRRAAIPVLALISVLCVAGGYLKGIGELLALDRVISFAPFFYAGYFLGVEGLERMFRRRPPLLMLAVFAGIALYIFFLFGSYDIVRQYAYTVYGAWYEYYQTELYYPFIQKNMWILRFVWYLAAGCMTISFLYCVPTRRGFFTVTGQRTLQIYILHRLVRDIYLILGLREFIDPEKPLHVFYLVVVGLAFSVVLRGDLITDIFNFIENIPRGILSWISDRTDRTVTDNSG